VTIPKRAPELSDRRVLATLLAHVTYGRHSRGREYGDHEGMNTQGSRGSTTACRNGKTNIEQEKRNETEIPTGAPDQVYIEGAENHA